MSMIDELNTVTNAYWMPVLINQIFKAHPVLDKLYNATKYVDGGNPFNIPLGYGESNGGAYAKEDTLTITPTKVVGGASFTWAHYWAGNSIFEIDLNENSGKAKIIDVSRAKMQSIEDTLRKKIAADLFTAQTGNHMLSILDAVDYATTVTYGGISRADYTWWRGTKTAVNGALTFDVMETAMNNAYQIPKEYPQLIITTQTLWEKFWKLTLDKVGFFDTAKAIQTGAVPFGKAEVIWDEYVPSGTMWFINTNHMYLVSHPQDNFKSTGWVDVLAATGQRRLDERVFWTGQLICDCPASCVELTGLT